MKKTRAPDVTDEMLSDLLNVLDEWSGKLTWDLLLDEIEKKVGHRYSRFTFADYPAIASAFSLKKQSLRGLTPSAPATPRDEKVRAVLEQNDRLKEKNKRLEAQNNALLAQYITWATNAKLYGMTIEDLAKPLVKPTRDRSKKAK